MIGRRALAAALVVAMTVPAAADPHHVLVLRGEGPADDATRAHIDTVVLRLAKHLAGQVTLGDISFTDAAAAVGCSGDAAACKDDVLSTMAADEVIATTIEQNGPDLQVTVRRASKGEAIRSAVIAVAAGDPGDQTLVRGLGPLFGIAASAEPTPPPTPDQPTPTPAPPTDQPTPDQPPPPTTPTEPATVTAAPDGTVDVVVPEHRARHNLELIGLASGGVVTVLGLLLWNAAQGTQSDINAAPTRTAADLMNLQSLESRGDGQAALGNVFVVGGLALAGVSAFLYIRDRHAHHAPSGPRLAPVALDHGAGITLTFGGAP